MLLITPFVQEVILLLLLLLTLLCRLTLLGLKNLSFTALGRTLIALLPAASGLQPVSLQGGTLHGRNPCS